MCQHGLKQLRDDRFCSSRASIDAHTQIKIDSFLASNGAMWCFHNQVSMNYLVTIGIENIAGAHRVCFRTATVHKIFSWS